MELLTRSLRRDVFCCPRHCGPTFAVHVRELRNYPIKVLCRNQKFVRKAAGSYFEVEREWNLGIVLQPSEVKSLRDHNADLSTAFGAFYQHELFLHDMTIPGRNNVSTVANSCGDKETDSLCDVSPLCQQCGGMDSLGGQSRRECANCWRTERN